MKIVNLPRRATEEMIKKFITKRIKGSAKIEKFSIENGKNKNENNSGVGYV